MQLVSLAGAALVLGVLASPTAAQPIASAQLSSSAQATPEAPPPEAQSLPEPPPFPPMPKAKPSHRWTSSNHHVASAHHVTHARKSSTAGHHRGSATRHSSTHHRISRTHHETAHNRALKLSAKDVRYCHRLTYTKIMRSSTCRALMSEELKSAGERRHHHATHRQGTTHRGKTTKAHSRHSKRHR